jgi:hypothetical protein
MIDAQNTDADKKDCWLELANGGGVMLRDARLIAPSKPKHPRHRQPKQLEAASAKDL